MSGERRLYIDASSSVTLKFQRNSITSVTELHRTTAATSGCKQQLRMRERIVFDNKAVATKRHACTQNSTLDKYAIISLHYVIVTTHICSRFIFLR